MTGSSGTAMLTCFNNVHAHPGIRSGIVALTVDLGLGGIAPLRLHAIHFKHPQAHTGITAGVPVGLGEPLKREMAQGRNHAGGVTGHISP